MSCFSFICGVEFFKRLLTSVALILCIGGAYVYSVPIFSFLLVAIFFTIVTFELPKLIHTPTYVFIFISMVYPGIPIGILIYLNHKFHNTNLLIPAYPFLAAWTADTFGYFFGKSIGKHKICPRISPGKSWEGFLGSFLGSIVLNSVILQHLEFSSLYNSNFTTMLFVSISYTSAAFAGGFLVSFFKRKNNLKDTGNTLPGHGGFLDRFDSVFACAVLTWLII